jgi:hypothetical protein
MSSRRAARFSRRSLLAGAGVSLAFLPLLAADREAHGAMTVPKRLVLIAWPNGVRSADWWPDARPGSIDYAEAENHGVTSTNFSFAGLRMIEPLEVHRQDVVLFHGVSLATGVEGGHESQPHMFKVSGNSTLDQHVGRNQDTPFKTLNLAVQKHDDRGHIYNNGQNVTLEEDPYALFERLFQGGALDTETFERKRAGKKSVLDYVGRQLEGFGKIVGSEDRLRVEHHLTSIRELEKRLDATSLGGGRPDSLPETRFDVASVGDFDKATRAQLDLLVLALASDATRVATLLLADGDGSNLATPWLGPQFALDTGEQYLGIQNSHHTHSHREDDMHAEMQRWFVAEFAHFIARLKETTDATGGRLFDSSVVLAMNNMNTGGGHGTNNLPVFYAGSAGGSLVTGRYLKLRENQNGILAALAGAVGVPVPGMSELAALRT